MLYFSVSQDHLRTVTVLSWKDRSQEKHQDRGHPTVIWWNIWAVTQVVNRCRQSKRISSRDENEFLHLKTFAHTVKMRETKETGYDVVSTVHCCTVFTIQLKGEKRMCDHPSWLRRATRASGRRCEFTQPSLHLLALSTLFVPIAQLRIT